jgi:hypothetical protein
MVSLSVTLKSRGIEKLASEVLTTILSVGRTDEPFTIYPPWWPVSWAVDRSKSNIL